MSRPPLATKAILIAALPALLREWAIFPPSSLHAARVWKVLTLEGRVGDDLEDPYSTAILLISLNSSYRESMVPERREEGEREIRTTLDRDRVMV